MSKETIYNRFAVILKALVEEKGNSILLNPYIVNMLSDYQVLQNQPAIKGIIRALQNQGYMNILIDTNIWEIDSKSVSSRFAYENGFQEDLVSYIIKSLGYAMSKVNAIPSLFHKEITQKTCNNNFAEKESEAQDNNILNIKEPFTRYRYPNTSLLTYHESWGLIDEKLVSAKDTVCNTFVSFGIKLMSIYSHLGPIIDSHILKIACASDIKKIYSFESDIILKLSVLGKCRLLINEQDCTCTVLFYRASVRNVCINDIINSKEFSYSNETLPIGLGIDMYNKVVVKDLATMPNLLICGEQGQGKSVCLNTILTTLLYKKHPNEIKFVLVDPKRIELGFYDVIMDKFGMATESNSERPILFQPQQIEETLKALLVLIKERHDKLVRGRAKNSREYNNKYIHHQLKLVDGHDFMPYIVTVIDSFETLCPNNSIETLLLEILKNGYDVGIHVIISSQYYPENFLSQVKTGLFAKIAFRLTEQESKRFLERTGAEKLCQPGFMLLSEKENTTFIQGAFVETEETERIVDFIHNQPGPIEPDELPNEKYLVNDKIDKNLDPYFYEAARLLVRSQLGSTSLLQRHFSISYNRAGRMMDQLESAGIVGFTKGSMPREVLIKNESQLETLLRKLKD